MRARACMIMAREYSSMHAIRIFCIGTRRGAGIWAVLISLSEIVLNKRIPRGLNMTSQRNKKQEHINEKLHGSHWIMDIGVGRC